MNKKEVGGKKSWNQKLEDFLEIPVWILDMWRRRFGGWDGEHVQEEGSIRIHGIFFFFFPLAWRNPNSKTSSEIWRRSFKLVLSKQ